MADETAVANLETTMSAIQTYADLIESNINDAANGADIMWLLICGILVFFMQAGFALLEAGSVRSMNTVNILFKNLIDGGISAISFWLFGYAFAYGDTARGFIGKSRFGLADSDFDLGDGNEQYQSFFFQWAFAATAATIVSGSVAERCKLEAYFIYSVFITMWIYPVVVHWVWGEGWLSGFASDTEEYLMYGRKSNNYIDFAGSSVVHMVGGISGLVGAYVLGPRKGRFDEFGNVVPFPGHSVPLVLLGTIILWVGWYGFNPGSTLCIVGDCSKLASKVAVVTTIAAASGGLSMVAYQVRSGLKIDLAQVANGILAGLVSITAPCAVVDNWAAMVIGFIGCGVYIFSSWQLQRHQIDDPLDASPIHGACGMWGTLAVGIFGTDNNAAFAGYVGSAGGFYPFRSGEQFAVQVTGLLVIVLWTFANALLLFTSINLTIGMRVPAEVEMSGLDKSEHGAEAYTDVQHDGGVVALEKPTKSDSAMAPEPSSKYIREIDESYATMDDEDRRAHDAWDGTRHQSAEFQMGEVHGHRGTSMLFAQGEYSYKNADGEHAPMLKKEQSAAVDVGDAYHGGSASVVLQSEDYSLDAARGASSTTPTDDAAAAAVLDDDDDDGPPPAMEKEKSFVP